MHSNNKKNKNHFIYFRNVCCVKHLASPIQSYKFLEQNQFKKKLFCGTLSFKHWPIGALHCSLFSLLINRSLYIRMANVNTRLYDLVNLVVLLAFAVDIRKDLYTEVIVDNISDWYIQSDYLCR